MSVPGEGRTQTAPHHTELPTWELHKLSLSQDCWVYFRFCILNAEKPCTLIANPAFISQGGG